MIELVVLSIALALDAAAVSASLGAAKGEARTLAVAAATFGVFQAGMAGAGALGGAWVAAYAAAWDHWIAFGLLMAIGGKMLFGATSEDQQSAALSLSALLALAIATSIDALAAGVSLPLLGPPLLVSLGMIGAVTLVLSAASAAAGRVIGAHLGPWVERAGGLALIAIGIHILVEHLWG